MKFSIYSYIKMKYSALKSSHTLCLKQETGKYITISYVQIVNFAAENHIILHTCANVMNLNISDISLDFTCVHESCSLAIFPHMLFCRSRWHPETSSDTLSNTVMTFSLLDYPVALKRKKKPTNANTSIIPFSCPRMFSGESCLR